MARSRIALAAVVAVALVAAAPAHGDDQTDRERLIFGLGLVIGATIGGEAMRTVAAGGPPMTEREVIVEGRKRAQELCRKMGIRVRPWMLDKNH